MPSRQEKKKVQNPPNSRRCFRINTACYKAEPEKKTKKKRTTEVTERERYQADVEMFSRQVKLTYMHDMWHRPPVVAGNFVLMMGVTEAIGSTRQQQMNKGYGSCKER